MGKRLVDVTAAAVALIVFSPVLLLAAVAIVLTSPGPVLFRQERVGKDGALFRMNKLRTMRDGADAGGQLTVGADARITPVGAWLRGHKLDELPQLYNVLV